MKKLLLVIPFLFLVQLSYADVAPRNTHRVPVCAKITNTNDFYDFAILSCYKHWSEKKYSCIIVNPDECVNDGAIVAVRGDYLESRDSIDWLNDKNIRRAHIWLGTYRHVNDNLKISSIDEFYKILEINDKDVVLYKYKELIRYSDGTPSKLKKYPHALVKQYFNYNEGIYPYAEVINFLEALLLTIGIETLILFLFFKTIYRNLKIRNILLLLTGITTSLATLPYVWFVFPVFIHHRIPYLIVSESFAVIIESFLIYKLLKIEFKKAFLVSLICNVISFSIGLLINYVTDSEYIFSHAILTLFK
ncbi:hypothetical protein [Flavobacterium hungaricum]|uniref:Uncharacterized protein n=1 Tax=Flavobacterium hungaricum TaxID=2082725 RepID=A0ABR9TE55_9FLAO|nr:hypothetical protein [Flavobacterium hungaricum]MBE8723550.1 hypothetical protein [Flavobacterium hungaricum]